MEIATALAAVQHQIAEACTAAGRHPSEVSLLAVSKKKPIKAILEAIAAGQTLFGENYVQEAVEKIRAIHDLGLSHANFHLIGPLQTNKARDAVAHFSLIQSVDREKLANAVAKEAEKMGKRQQILLQLNISGEESKSGCSLDQVPTLLERCLRLPSLQVAGLMSIGSPIDGAGGAAQTESEFAAMYELRERLQRDYEVVLPVLSMGMSDDFALAIKHGATLIRVGSAIFGMREQ